MLTSFYFMSYDSLNFEQNMFTLLIFLKLTCDCSYTDN